MTDKFTDEDYDKLYVKYTNLLHMYSKAMAELNESRLLVKSIMESLDKYERAVD